MSSRRAQFLPTGRSLAMRADAIGMLFEVAEGEREPFKLEGAAAVVGIRGPLVQHADPWWDSYDAISVRVAAAAASSARCVVLCVDSPGGDALGMMECARYLRATCRAAGKPLIGFVDGMACSAAFALMSSADRVLAAPASLVGSVGVFQPMLDATAADRAMGLVFEMVSSGERKLDGNPHVKISDAARAETQRRVDGLADLFFGLVAEMRPGVTSASMRALEGGIYLGAEAVTVGLADAVGSWMDVLALAGDQQALATAKAATEKETMAEEMKDDKKAKARKAFFSAMEAAFDSMFGDDEPKKEKDGEAKTAAEDAPPPSEDKEKKEAAAKAKATEEEKEKAKAAEETEKAKALTAKAAAGDTGAIMAIALKAQEDNATLRAEIAAKEDAHARAALFGKRPDFTAEQRELLALVPLAEVEKAVAKWPRGPMVGKLNPAAAVSANGTRGGNPNHRGAPEGATEVPAAEAKFIDGAMGLRADAGDGVQRKGKVLELGAMTPAQAREYLAKLDKDEAARANAQKEGTV